MANLYTRVLAASGLVTDHKYGRLAQITGAAGITVDVHDGPTAADDVLHPLEIPLDGCLTAPEGSSWRFPREACWVAVSGPVRLTFR